MKVLDALQGVTSILLDTAPVIYHLEKNPAFASTLDCFFRIRAERQILLVTTPITLAECLVHPIQNGRTELQSHYESLIVRGENTAFQPIGEREGIFAAHLRAKYGLTLADAFQVAIAQLADCQALLTNDAALTKVTEIRVLLVGDLQP